MKNKLVLLATIFFIASIAVHDFIDHHDHFSSESIVECNACEENNDVKVEVTKIKNNFDRIQYLSDLILRYIPSNNLNSDLPRAPPSN